MVAQPSQPLSHYVTVEEWRELQRTSHVELVSLGISFPLAALYKYTDVPENLDLPEGEI